MSEQGWQAERALIHAALNKAGVPDCDNIPLRIEELACRKLASAPSAPPPDVDIMAEIVVKDGRVEVRPPSAPPPTICKVRAAGKTDPPQDCDWPFCGCDEHATKVLDTLQECGWGPR